MEISELIEKRNAARAAKQWAIADQLRDEAIALGYKLVDKKEGTVAIALAQPDPDFSLFPNFRFLLDNFYLSYIDDDGRQWSMCIAPHTKLPGFEETLRKAIAQQSPEIRERLKVLLNNPHSHPHH